MRNDKLSVQSMDFAVSIIHLVKQLKEKRESIISNQIGRRGIVSKSFFNSMNERRKEMRFEPEYKQYF